MHDGKTAVLGMTLAILVVLPLQITWLFIPTFMLMLNLLNLTITQF